MASGEQLQSPMLIECKISIALYKTTAAQATLSKADPWRLLEAPSCCALSTSAAALHCPAQDQLG